MFHCCGRCRACFTGFILPYSLQSIPKGNQRRNSGPWLKQRSWREAAYWIALHGSVLAFFYTQDHLLGDGTTRSGLNPHTSIINQENALHAFVQAKWRYFLSWDSLFPAYPSLCQVNKNQPTQEAETSTLFFIRFCYRFKNQNESYHTTSPNDLFHGTIFPLLSKLGEVCSPPLLPSPSMNIKIITLSFPQNQVGLFIAISFSLF